MLTSGARHIGWKAGFGAPAALQRFGLTGPLVGYLTDATLCQDRSERVRRGMGQPGRRARARGPHWNRRAREGRERVAEAISGIGSAIELADIDPPPDDVEEILAGDIYHRAVVLGDPDPALAGGSIDGVTAAVTHNGVSLQPITDLEALTGRLLEVIAHIADTLAESGEALRAGDVVITGSIIPAIPIGPGQSVEFRLGSTAPVSVSLH